MTENLKGSGKRGMTQKKGQRPFWVSCKMGKMGMRCCGNHVRRKSISHQIVAASLVVAMKEAFPSVIMIGLRDQRIQCATDLSHRLFIDLIDFRNRGLLPSRDTHVFER